jgi:hypothetical protein
MATRMGVETGTMMRAECSSSASSRTKSSRQLLIHWVGKDGLHSNGHVGGKA